MRQLAVLLMRDANVTMTTSEQNRRVEQFVSDAYGQELHLAQVCVCVCVCARARVCVQTYKHKQKVQLLLIVDPFLIQRGNFYVCFAVHLTNNINYLPTDIK